MSGRIIVDNAMLYAKMGTDRKTVRKWESNHKDNPCNNFESFQEYLSLMTYSFVPKFLSNLSDPSAFADGAEGHVLGQKLARLLEQLANFSSYVTPGVAAQMQAKVNAFWELGKEWEKENLKNLTGNPSNWFEKVEKHEGLSIFQSSEGTFKSSEGLFKTYIIN